MAAAIAGAATTAPAAETATVPGNVAGWMKNAIRTTEKAPAERSVAIAVHLSLRDTSGLKTLVREVSSPESHEYGRYLTTEEFAARFAPSASAVKAVETLLKDAGMTNITVGPHGMYVSATATVSQLSKTFHVTQELYSYKGMTLRANREAPTIPAALAGKVLFIQGLDDTALLRQPFHHSVTVGNLVAPQAATKSTKPAVTPPPVASNNPSPYCNQYFGGPGELVATLSTAADVYGAAIPWLGCGYTPQQIRAAYGLNRVKYNGKGVTVAIIDAYASPTLLADSNRYAANHGLPRLVNGVNFSQIIPIGIYDVDPNAPCGPYGWWEEQSLDMAAVHGSAPGADILYVGSVDCATSLDQAFINTVVNHLADIVTDSWGYNGEAIPPGLQGTYDQAAQAGGALGVSILFSSGDDGDLAALNGVASGSWPATSAWVTGVGGTTLQIKDATGTKAESGWGTYRAYLADAKVKSARSVLTSGVTTTTVFGVTFDDYSFYSGSGGGISLLEPQPSYQARAVPPYLAVSLNLASGFVETLPMPMRVSPDVAMVGDPYTGYLFGETFTIAHDPILDSGCTPISETEEYCEADIGGTSLSSPLMAGVIAVMNQKRMAGGEPVVGFANPLFYSTGSEGDGLNLTFALNQIIAPPEPVAVLRGYKVDLTRVRVVTINSVPFQITPAPYPIEVCGLPVCLGLNDVWNWTSLASASVPPTPAGYNDVTGLGVPWAPKLIREE